MTQPTISYLARLSAVIFGAVVSCFFASPALATPDQDAQVFLFAKAKCFGENGAPYSIAATTFNPVIYHMSISDEDETKDLNTTRDSENDLAGCKQEALKVSFVPSTTGTCSIAPPQLKHIKAHTTDQGVFIPASIEMELPPEQGESCSSAEGPNKCEDHPPLPTLTVLKISQASAWHRLATPKCGSWKCAGKVRMDQVDIKTPLSKGPASHRGHPDTPPPQMG